MTGTNEQTIGRPSYRPGSFFRFCLCKADRLAALLLIPYLLWLCYATALNLAIALMNP